MRDVKAPPPFLETVLNHLYGNEDTDHIVDLFYCLRKKGIRVAKKILIDE